MRRVIVIPEKSENHSTSNTLLPNGSVEVLLANSKNCKFFAVPITLFRDSSCFRNKEIVKLTKIPKQKT